MTIAITPFTDPEIVIEHLESLLNVLVPSLNFCCRQSTQYFFEKDLSFDSGLHSYLTRHHLLNILRQKSIEAIEEENNEYYAEGQALCGLRIETDQCVVKILKHPSTKKDLPSTTTDQRTDFYQANLDFRGSVGGEPQKVNLVILWDTDPRHNLLSMAVACPYGVKYKRALKKWWQTLDIDAFEDIEFMRPEEAPEPELEEITPKLQAIESTPDIAVNSTINVEAEERDNEGRASTGH